MWFDEAVIYQIYPLGLCGAPAENDGVQAHRILRLAEWAAHIRQLGADTVLLNLPGSLPAFDFAERPRPPVPPAHIPWLA